MAALLAAMALSSGCDSASFVTPPPPELKKQIDSGFAANYDRPGPVTESPVPAGGKAESRRPPGAARIVELILARPGNADRDYLQLALRREMGKGRIMFHPVQPDPGTSASPAWLAGSIRSAVHRGVAGLIVEPLDDPAVIDALYDADGRGVALLLLDRAIPPRNGKTIPRVEFVFIDDVGRRIAEDVLEADQSLHRTRPGRAILLHHRADDPYLDRCHAAMLRAIKASGKPAEEIAFEGGSEKAEEALEKSLARDPNIDILLTDDAYGMAAGYKIQGPWAKAGHPEFLLAGFAPYDTRTPELLARAQAFGDRSVEAYAMKVARAIRDRLDRKAVDDVLGVPVTFHRQSKLYVATPAEPAAPEKAGKP